MFLIKKKEKKKVISVAGSFGPPYLGKATAAARPALLIPTSACSMFVCLNTGVAASVQDFIFNTCFTFQ